MVNFCISLGYCKKDEIVGAGPVKARGEVAIVCQAGIGKRVDLDQFPKQGRYGQGVIAIPTGGDTGPVAVAAVVNLSNRIMFISKKKNSKTVYARALGKLSRTGKGKSIMSIRDKDAITQLVVLDV